MINTQDLIKNAYLWHKQRGLVRITQIGETTVGGVAESRPHESTFFLPDKLRPIPISPQWLKRLGFEKASDASDEDRMGWQWNPEFDEYDYLVEVEPKQEWVLRCSNNFIAKLDGVHHLQALIWFMERQRLTLQPIKTNEKVETTVG
ncbi:hypothetical protein [Spirosoma sp.]|uniref:hypothetical protein n=1 Tax=Spirosoma sp. TaxID=1899569 RepID=UPI00260B5339|nr:hypothetical protein [Spirosoma sp.]MCX6217694.1 hypothetical protein [Spirosoma sp.]